MKSQQTMERDHLSSTTYQQPLVTAAGIGSSTDQHVSTAHTGAVKAATIMDSVKFQLTTHGLK